MKMVTKYKKVIPKSSRPFYEYDIKNASNLQEKLQRQGFYVTYHPTYLKIHIKLEEERYKYLKTNKMI